MGDSGINKLAWLWRRHPSAKPGQTRLVFQEGQRASSALSDGGSCIDHQIVTLEKISRPLDTRASRDDVQMLRALACEDSQMLDYHRTTTTRVIPDGGSCTDLQFLETISQEFNGSCPKPSHTSLTSTFSKMRYTPDGGSSNDLQKLETTTSATHWVDDSQMLCDDNTEDLVQHTGIQKFLNSDVYQMPERKPSVVQPAEANALLVGGGAYEDGFTLEELSEMETTSGSSDVTNLMVSKEEYNFSSFEFSFDDSQTVCQSEVLESDTSFWNHMLGNSGDGMTEQSTFPSSSVLDELPTTIKYTYPVSCTFTPTFTPC